MNWGSILTGVVVTIICILFVLKLAKKVKEDWMK